MSLEQQIMTEMKEAMKAKNEGVLRALRGIKAEIIKAKTKPGAGGEIDETTEQKFLKKIINNAGIRWRYLKNRDVKIWLQKKEKKWR